MLIILLCDLILCTTQSLFHQYLLFPTLELFILCLNFSQMIIMVGKPMYTEEFALQAPINFINYYMKNEIYFQPCLVHYE